MEDHKKWYDAHLAGFRQGAEIKSFKQYEELYRRSIDAPEKFWAEQAETYLSWDKKWDFVFHHDFDEARFQWFGGGKLNAAFNCLDRHLLHDTRGDKVAYFWEGENPDETKKVTYGELYNDVNRLALWLKSVGVQKGDCVVIYMPMVVEQVVAMLACARIGAIHCVVFTGFSSKPLANCIQNCQARVLITADQGYRYGKVVPIKKHVDNALTSCPEVRSVLVLQRGPKETPILHGRDTWWHHEMEKIPAGQSVAPEPMDAEDPLFVFYYSGFSNNPKGLVHTHGGYLLYSAMTTRLVFDLKDDDIFWCTTDIGRIAGHSYTIYGSLLNGATCVLYEGGPAFPDYDRYWQIVEKYRVTKFYTTPSLIRLLARQDDNFVKAHDLSSIKLLGTGCESIDPEAWKWFYNVVGGARCPVVDTYWQSETGGHVLTPLPGVAPLKPGSCALPFFGIDPVILDDTGEQTKFPDQEGVLCIRKPWPGMARTVYGDHERYIHPYFSRVLDMYFTGDAARQDEDGYYWIMGRVDDVINITGFGINAEELEAALCGHPKISEVAVVKFPHPVKGIGIYAFVTLRSRSDKSDELKSELVRKVRTDIGPIAQIDVIQWADALPRTRSGKLLRTILDKIAANQIDELGDTSVIADSAVIESLIKERKKIQDL